MHRLASPALRELLIVLLVFAEVCRLFGAGVALADEPDPQTNRAEWYKKQKLNEETRKRLGISWTSCCDAGDRYRTRFRIVDDGSKHGADAYEYEKDGVWKPIHPDIIRRKPTPDDEPILFIDKQTGNEVCFVIGKGGV